MTTKNRVPMWTEPEGYSRLRPGTWVITFKSAERDTWTDNTRSACQWGAKGTIVAHHDSHGLCYDVIHADGTTACYDPDELGPYPSCLSCGSKEVVWMDTCAPCLDKRAKENSLRTPRWYRGCR